MVQHSLASGLFATPSNFEQEQQGMLRDQTRQDAVFEVKHFSKGAHFPQKIIKIVVQNGECEICLSATGFLL